MTFNTNVLNNKKKKNRVCTGRLVLALHPGPPLSLVGLVEQAEPDSLEERASRKYFSSLSF